MGVVLLARHGETDWNAERRFQGHADRPLNERGRAQAEALAARLERVRLAAVYASTLLRARQTAEIVARPHGLEVRTRSDLKEVDVGSWSGLTTSEAAARYPDHFVRWRDKGRPGWHGGETYEQVRDRALGAVLEIGTLHVAEIALVVAHGGTIRALLATALGIDVHEYRHVHPAEPNGGLSGLRVADGRLTGRLEPDETERLLRRPGGAEADL